MKKFISNLFKKKTNDIGDNPFTKPYIYDKNIDIFHDCPVCKSSLYNDDDIPVVRPDLLHYKGEDILILACDKCKSKFRFRNWDKPKSE